MPCKLGKESCVCSNEQKQFCKNWEPGRGTKYYKCARFLNTRATCDKDQEACLSCPHFIGDLPKREARIDWSDPEAVRQHRAKYMRDYRKGKRRRT